MTTTLFLTAFSLFLLGTEAFYGLEYLKQNEQDTLILTNILFRHGDRTPVDTQNIFPTNPYINDSFFPYGTGQLTLEGKRRAYDLGYEFRKRYYKFLGPLYYTGLIEALSTEVDRTIMSLQGVLAGMFPPIGRWKLRRSLDWQPVPFRYIPSDKDLLMSGYKNCPSVLNATDFDEETQEVVVYLREYTGGNITTLYDVAMISNTFQVLEELGKELPDWVGPIWPEPLKTIALQAWSYIADHKVPEVAGELIRKINEDSAHKINGTLPKGRKVFMYSGHDINIVGLLGALGLYDGFDVHYSSYIIIEVHNIDGVYGVKVFFENDAIPKPDLMDLPNCGNFCPYDKFVELTKQYYLPNHKC